MNGLPAAHQPYAKGQQKRKTSGSTPRTDGVESSTEARLTKRQVTDASTFSKPEPPKKPISSANQTGRLPDIALGDGCRTNRRPSRTSKASHRTRRSVNLGTSSFNAMHIDGENGTHNKKLIGSVTDWSYPPEYITNHNQSSLQCGDIVWGPHTAPSLDRNNEIPSYDVALAESTGPISAKKRPFIVISQHTNHVLAVPMYSHSGLGDEWLRADRGKNYVTVLNLAEAQTSLWRDVEHLVARLPFVVRENTVAHVTEPYTLDYRYPLKVEGSLNDYSIIHLNRRFHDAITKGTESIRRMEEALRGNDRDEGDTLPMHWPDAVDQHSELQFRNDESTGGVPLGRYSTSKPGENHAAGVNTVQNQYLRRRKQSTPDDRRGSYRGSYFANSRGGRSQHSRVASTHFSSASRASHGYVDLDKPQPDAEDFSHSY